MASDKYQIVVQGEASETDSDDEVYITSLSPHSTAGGQKVPGEASETDSEGEVEKARKCVTAASSETPQILRKDLTPLLVIRDNSDIQSVVEERVVSQPEHSGLYYNTLLQQKLQESNARLCTDVSQTIKQVYGNATKEIRMATTHLTVSQNGIINASHSIRLILEDLKSVSEKMDIITSCYLLPDITIPSSPTTPIPGQ
ncbi:biogenesis of lysosome-related organelles complex 1 subunit 3 [Oncorhynchus tshawytscha]|uniref:Biogenesis of lysosome-related organelles complex 1 subunit 3 n=1 Tax=Oncorhynchus tshawytscha TaxID=74940 RepID=A0AAZ3PYA6_ONCTS|nr:biogenesis of lysosome-related organelles complex 1 subunit 3 [Oncorhynchus tshawytscha]XP_046170730.1 biogenesis of lysosome-related organelles complex 1 subunit 3-like [Oncorhynchus gorbuscha]